MRDLKCAVIYFCVFCNTATIVRLGPVPVAEGNGSASVSSALPPCSLSTELPQESKVTASFIHSFIASLSLIIVSELGDKTFFISAIMAMKYSALVVYAGAISALIPMTLVSVFFGWVVRVIPHDIIFFASTALFVIFGLMMLWEGCRMPATKAMDEMQRVETQLSERDSKRDLKASGSRINVANASTSKVTETAASTSKATETAASTSKATEATASTSKTPAATASKVDVQQVGKTQDAKEGDALAEAQNTDKEVIRRRLSVCHVYLETLVLVFLAEWGDRSQLSIIVLAADNDMVGVMLGGSLGHCLTTGLAVTGGRFVTQRLSVRLVTIMGGVVFLVFAFTSITFKYALDVFLHPNHKLGA